MNTMRKIVWGPVYITWDFSAFVGLICVLFFFLFIWNLGQLGVEIFVCLR